MWCPWLPRTETISCCNLLWLLLFFGCPKKQKHFLNIKSHSILWCFWSPKVEKYWSCTAIYVGWHFGLPKKRKLNGLNIGNLCSWLPRARKIYVTAVVHVSGFFWVPKKLNQTLILNRCSWLPRAGKIYWFCNLCWLVFGGAKKEKTKLVEHSKFCGLLVAKSKKIWCILV